MSFPIGLALFPGIKQIKSANFPFSAHGTVPSACVIEIAPQANFPDAIGPLVLSYGSLTIPFAGCKLNQTSFRRDAQGLVWALQILDRRWRWAEFTISGEYNVRLPDETLDTSTEMTPREAATTLLDTLGEVGYDVTALPDDARPYLKWDYSSVPHELDSLCDALGCRVVLQLDGTVKICRLGTGAKLPEGPMSDDAGAIEAADIPDSLRVVFAPTKVQLCFLARAIGQDIDGTTKILNELTYKPTAGWFSTLPGKFLNLAEQPAADKTAGQPDNSPRTLAQASVFKWYQIYDLLDKRGVERKLREKLGTAFNWSLASGAWQFLPLLPDVLQVDNLNNNLPPYVEGVFWKLDGLNNNSDEWAAYKRPFTMDLERGIIKFADFVAKWEFPGNKARTRFKEADIYLTACCNVMHPETRAVHRVFREKSLGGNNNTGPKILRQEEIAGTLQARYFEDGTLSRTMDNTALLNREADFQLNAYAAAIQPKAPQDRTYPGLVAINPDGAIHQVTWTCKEGTGASTRASRNTEYHLAVPTYKERLRMYAAQRNLTGDALRRLRRAAQIGGAV